MPFDLMLSIRGIFLIFIDDHASFYQNRKNSLCIKLKGPICWCKSSNVAERSFLEIKLSADFLRVQNSFCIKLTVLISFQIVQIGS